MLSLAATALRACLTALLLAAPAAELAAEPARPLHGIAMHGEPALPPDFTHLPYADPAAPKGGRITLALQGTFDALNPLIVLGVAPDVVPRYVLQSLMIRSADEPFTLYGLVARSVEMPADRSSVTFNLDPRARFSDGKPLTAEDVRFTFEVLKQRGKPFYRTTYGEVKGVEVQGLHRIRFDLAGSRNRELPLNLGLMPVFAAHATDPETFDKTSLTPPVGSGPYEFVELKPGERLTLRRRKDFWAADLPVLRGLYNAEEIRYDFYRDANALFEAFKAGLYDWRLEPDPGRWATGYDVPALREGRIKRESLPILTPKGMNGFVFNTRMALFADMRVREALASLFEFEWVNRNLYFGLVQRSDSFFAGSDLSSAGQPAGPEERRLLERFPGAVRPDILEGRWRPPAPDASGRDRDTARRALALLAEAGWTLGREGLRRRETGEPFAFDILVNSRPQERLALNYAQSLQRVGVQASVRLVDDVQYWRRLATYDYDMIQSSWPASASPGNEQRGRWGSSGADTPGTLNYAGVRSPAVDGLIDAIVAAESRDGFVAAVRALDRVLLSDFYAVPLFYVGESWLAYDSSLDRPAKTPLLGTTIDVWWRKTP